MALSDLYLALLAKNIVLVEGEVNEEMLERIRQSLIILEARESPEIEVRITSDGGKTMVGLQICDLLHNYPGKKTGVVYSCARSAGAIILQACDDRVCLPHSVVLIHHVLVEQISLDTLQNKRAMQKLQQLMLADQKAVYTLLVNRTGRTTADVRAACRKDADMTAREALAFGLIDRIKY